MAAADRLDAGDVARLLDARIVTLAAQLLPGGRRDGAVLRVGSVAGEPGESMTVHLAGARRGHWCDFAAAGAGGKHLGGDALELVRHAM